MILGTPSKIKSEQEQLEELITSFSTPSRLRTYQDKIVALNQFLVNPELDIKSLNFNVKINESYIFDHILKRARGSKFGFELKDAVFRMYLSRVMPISRILIGPFIRWAIEEGNYEVFNDLLSHDLIRARLGDDNNKLLKTAIEHVRPTMVENLLECERVTNFLLYDDEEMTHSYSQFKSLLQAAVNSTWENKLDSLRIIDLLMKIPSVQAHLNKFKSPVASNSQAPVVFPNLVSTPAPVITFSKNGKRKIDSKDDCPKPKRYKEDRLRKSF